MDTKEIKGLLNEIRVIKSEHAKKAEEIRKQDLYSDAWKREQLGKLERETAEALAKIADCAEEAVSAVDGEIAKYFTFDYANPKLVAAMQFMQIAGNNVPAEAWKAMIADLDGHPQELRFLSGLFDKSGAKDAAVAAAEAVKNLKVKESLPDRLSDAIYYACNTTVETDFSGVEAELNALEDAAEAVANE